MRTIKECVLYRGFENAEPFVLFSELMGKYPAGNPYLAEPSAADREAFFGAVQELLDLAGAVGFEGNLWQHYLAYLLVNHENAFSKACEIRGDVGGSLHEAALHDMALLKELFDYPLERLGDVFGSSLSQILLNFQSPDTGGKMYNRRIRDRIGELADSLSGAADEKEFLSFVTGFYRDYGVGKLGLHKAFRVGHDQEGRVVIEPIKKIAHVKLDDLVGYEIPKRKLVENTEAFVEGRRANNCLLYGDAGTGKSSSIKGILNQYYDRGLRIIEVYKHQFQDLNDIVAQIKDRNYRFIIYMDDLSFEEFETEYKYLKAVIEGGLERKPENILIYATSNRRHLVRERASDKLELMDEDDLHSSDTVQEKLSLVYRFGVRIYFGSPDRKQFQNIVRVLAERDGVDLPPEKLLSLANAWEISHGGMTGRTAQQFIDHLVGSGSENLW